MEAGREPRLGDVAERAGVSVATVSRVLNNRGYLNAATRERVSKAIEELAYRPTQVARSLLSQRTGCRPPLSVTHRTMPRGRPMT